MKKTLLWLGLFLLLLFVCGFDKAPFWPAPQKKLPAIAAAQDKQPAFFLLDNFEDGTYTENPEWYVFDNIVPAVVQNSRFLGQDLDLMKSLGRYSLQLRGSTANWYVGGIGTIVQQDVFAYDAITLAIYGYDQYSGVLKIELYDDDNGNAEIEVDPNWQPLYDDRFVCEIPVNWQGWRLVTIPLKDFKRDGGGNKVFDPGLVKVQLVGLANSESGSVKINVDNLGFTKQ